MARDDDLADRIRALVGGDTRITEKRMFGGLAFLVNGKMAVAASGQDGLLVRIDPAECDSLLAENDAQPMVMRGRAMRGWLRVGSEQVRTDRQLAPWVERGVDYAATLSPPP